MRFIPKLPWCWCVCLCVYACACVCMLEWGLILLLTPHAKWISAPPFFISCHLYLQIGKKKKRHSSVCLARAHAAPCWSCWICTTRRLSVRPPFLALRLPLAAKSDSFSLFSTLSVVSFYTRCHLICMEMERLTDSPTAYSSLRNDRRESHVCWFVFIITFLSVKKRKNFID